MDEIIQVGNKVLEQSAARVPLEKITTQDIKKIIRRMKKAVHAEKDAVAIAAPQISERLRIFVVSGEVFKSDDDKEEALIPSDMVFINPTITKLSRKKILTDEGCLSVRGKYGKVKRSIKATVRAYDERGKRFERGGSGLLAQIFQHEVDHLNGILFIDKATDIRDTEHEKHGM